ncbi:HEAT repeat domain-containing protein [Candidatus Methylospira mobilis]|uniref:HEAT repeat domain-containing protein n=1 Tax=Candidatus Methylospira mobilis TaxID=1808979 RepID=A0A5Q0BQM1_9GAMM|nr:HEAT repeat domain-containing protein [Candidatus Methylospira mobilis]QFY44377.1 HEAT repeat domain-containing protein [Candidatus Methylospira mobilis]WNV06187.1 HEAT repeat domain-containing protein [Candidatus Methylospira mobilis]
MPIIKQQAPQISGEDKRQRPRDFDGLTAALNSGDEVIRRWAVRDLAEFPAAGGALAARLKREPNAAVRNAILTALTRLGDKEAVDGLVECLRSEDVALRNAAMEAMKELPAEVAPIMDTLLSDNDPDVRIFAVSILESLRHPRVEVWLKAVIEHDPHVNVCATAADLLSELASEISRTALERLPLRFPEEPYIAFVTDLALKRLNEDRSR